MSFKQERIQKIRQDDTLSLEEREVQTLLILTDLANNYPQTEAAREEFTDIYQASSRVVAVVSGLEENKNAKPKPKTGGEFFFMRGGDDPMSLSWEVGQSAKPVKYKNFALGKVLNLLRVKDATSSRQVAHENPEIAKDLYYFDEEKDENLTFPGGAIRFFSNGVEYLFGFSGFSVIHDEVMCLLIAVETGLLNATRAEQIALNLSNYPSKHEESTPHEQFRRVMDKMRQTPN